MKHIIKYILNKQASIEDNEWDNNSDVPCWTIVRIIEKMYLKHFENVKKNPSNRNAEIVDDRAVQQ